MPAEGDTPFDGMGGLEPRGEFLAIDGLLWELGRAGHGHDKQFISKVMSALESDAATAGRPISATAIRAAARRRLAGSRRRRGISKTRAWLRYGVLPAAVAAAALITAHLVNLKIIVDTQAALCAEVIDLGGPVELVNAQGTAPARKGDLVRPGEGLKTGAGGRVKLRYQDRTTLEVRERTDLSLKKNRNPRDPSKSLKLTRGELSADVVRQKPDAPMTVITLHAQARVIGTRFTLKAEAEKTRLEVEEGKVRLARGTQSVEVAGGSFAEAGPRIGLALNPTSVRPAPGPAESRWRDASKPGWQAVCSGAEVALRRMAGGRSGGQATAVFDGTVPAHNTVRASGEVRLGTAGGTPYFEFHSSGDLRLLFSPSGKAWLESRRSRGASFERHGRRLTIKQGGPIRFELTLDPKKVTCLVNGELLYQGAHNLGLAKKPLLLGPTANRANRAGTIGTFSSLRVSFEP